MSEKETLRRAQRAADFWGTSGGRLLRAIMTCTRMKLLTEGGLSKTEAGAVLAHAVAQAALEHSLRLALHAAERRLAEIRTDEQNWSKLGRPGSPRPHETSRTLPCVRRHLDPGGGDDSSG